VNGAGLAPGVLFAPRLFARDLAREIARRRFPHYPEREFHAALAEVLEAHSNADFSPYGRTKSA
jgi:hypothetical protein